MAGMGFGGRGTKLCQNGSGLRFATSRPRAVGSADRFRTIKGSAVRFLSREDKISTSAYENVTLTRAKIETLTIGFILL